MTAEHNWRECRPALLATEPDVPPPAPGALEMAWSLVPDRDRRLFHEFCCHFRQDDAHLAAAQRIAALIELSLEARPPMSGA